MSIKVKRKYKVGQSVELTGGRSWDAVIAEVLPNDEYEVKYKVIHNEYGKKTEQEKTSITDKLTYVYFTLWSIEYFSKIDLTIYRIYSLVRSLFLAFNLSIEFSNSCFAGESMEFLSISYLSIIKLSFNLYQNLIL